MTEIVRIAVAVWSDYVCPFCYLEEPVLEEIRDEFGAEVAIEWRAYELRPAPVPTLDPRGAYLRNAWTHSVLPLAAQRGMVMRLPPVQPRSRRALEAAEFARAHGKFDAMHHALFRAFFEAGRDIGDLTEVEAIGAAAGLDAAALRRALDEGRHAEAVLADQREANRLGISAVPTMLVHRLDEPIERGLAVVGAQPYETVRAAIERARTGAVDGVGRPVARSLPLASE